MSNTTSESWLDCGYELFSQEGLEEIKVERLAQILNLNKSGFYHYFGSRQSFMEQLMKKHFKIAGILVQDLRSVEEFDPQFIEVLIKHSTAIMVHNQLVRNRHDGLLNKTYHLVNDIVDPVVIPLFADFIGFKDYVDFSAKYYRQVRDGFYTQISFDRMTYPFLRDFLHQAKEVLQQAANLASLNTSLEETPN